MSELDKFLEKSQLLHDTSCVIGGVDICTDCRAYVEDPEDILSKPLKCGYNPYTAEWSEWSSNPLKQKTINFYGLCEMVDDTESKNSSTV